ncbi:MAG: hypothetical protein ACUZ8H_16090 [Candidatus Anammoxibacter sp.]
MKQRHILNGVEINEPNNYAGLELEINYDKDGSTETVSINEWEFGVGDGGNSNDGAIIINDFIDKGLIGGVGVGEGIPYKLLLDDEKGSQRTLFDGYINIWKSEIECDLITAPAIELFDPASFENKLDSFSFKYLESIGLITSSDYVPIPYCINKKVNGLEVIIALVTVFVLIDKIKEQVSKIAESVARMASLFGYTEVIALIASILYMVVLIAALIKLIIDLYNIIVQPVKYHYGMYERDLMIIGLKHLGYKLSSSILDSEPFKFSVIMPEKFNVKEDNTGKLKFVTGFFNPNPNEQEGYFKGTFGELFRALVEKYDAKIRIIGDVVHFEKQAFSLNSPAFQFPPIEKGIKRLNHNDFVSNKIISFSVDMQDRNTIQEYKGTSVQITTTPISITNSRMVLLENYQPINIPFALAKRKTELTFVEKILNGFFKAIGKTLDILTKVLNAVIELINIFIELINDFLDKLSFIGIDLDFEVPLLPKIKGQNIDDLIENRIDLMVLESDYTSVPKMLLLKKKSNPRNNKLLSNNEAVQNAKYLYENFHKFRSFVPSGATLPFQYEIRSFSDISICFDDYIKLRENSQITDSDGNVGELISLKFNPYRETGSGSFKIKKIYTINLQEKITEPDGK